MPSGVKRPSSSDLMRCRIVYFVELARSSSYIASTQSPATQRVAIAEAFNEFMERYGARDFSVFVELLARNLEERRKPESANAVRQDLRLQLSEAV
jgi:hypothetical protein